MEFVFRIQQEVKECAKVILAGTLGVPRSWKRKEVEWNSYLATAEGNWDSTATQMVERYKETAHPVFKNISVLSCGFLKKKNGRDTIHFNADASNTELLFRRVHSFCKSAQYLRSTCEFV